MKRIALIAVLLASGITFGQATKPAKSRVSLDGAPLPDATTNHDFTVKLPLIGDVLGRAPDELSPRVLNSKRSGETLKRAIGVEPETEWFIVRHADTEGVGLDLTGGRASRVIVYLTATDSLQEEELVAKYKPTDKRVTIHATRTPRQKRPDLIKLEFVADPVDFYAGTRDLSPEVAAAMKARVFTKGMTPAEQLMVNNGPGLYIVEFASQADREPGGSALELKNPIEADFSGTNTRDYPKETVKADSREEAVAIAKAKYDPKKWWVFKVTLREPKK